VIGTFVDEVDGASLDPLSLADVLLQHPRAQSAVGSRWPTERELEESLGVSRHHLRRALELLEREGWITRHVGRGTFVARSAESYRPGQLAAPVAEFGASRDAGSAVNGSEDHTSGSELSDIAPADVLGARRVIEPSAMLSAITRATSRDFDAVCRCLAGGDSARSHAEFEYWDLELHRAIVAATHNPLLVRLYRLIEEAGRSSIWGRLGRDGSSEEARSAHRLEHHAIVEALLVRDSPRAAEAMQHHLARIEEDVFARAGCGLTF